MESNGQRKNLLWFRFLGDALPVEVHDPAETVGHSSRRHSLMSPADIKLNTSRASTPMSKQSVLLLDQFYENCRQCGKLRANIFHQPEVVAFLSDIEKEASTADREIVDYASPMDTTDHSASSSGSSSSANDEKNAFVAMCFQAPLSHQRAFVVQYVKQHTSNAVYWNAPPFPQGPVPATTG
jgi:hypothetical protein